MKYNIGVEIGATLIQAAIVDKYGRLLARCKTPSHLDRPLPDIIQTAAELVMDLVEKQDLDIKSAKSIGVASPGEPDAEGTKILKSYVTGFYNAPIKEEFAKYFKQPVYVENDAHCAALAESVAGAAEDLDYSVTINIGTGISGGIIINNRIYAGFNGAGASMRTLVQALVKNRVRPYYIYQCDLSLGIAHFRTPVSKGIEIIEGLRGHTSGYAVPTFVVDAPGGGGKTPVMPQYVISQSPDKVILRNYEGVITTYSEPKHQDEMECTCDFCTGKKEYHYEGVAGLLAGERMSMEPSHLLRHERNKK